jgi:hypothetical protein
VIEISSPIWSQTVEHFRTCGGRRRECVAYWIGPAHLPGTVTRVVHPIHTATGRHYRVDDAWLTRFWVELAGTGETVRVQVHTHGGRACHSPTDDEGALVYEPGFLSLVVPGFAMQDDAVDRTYLAELDAFGRWHEVTIGERLQWSCPARDALARTILLTKQFRLPDVTDAAIVRGLSQTTVCIVADERNLTSAAAQSLVSTLAGLVFCCGMRVRLVMRPVAIAGYQPPLIGEELTQAIIELGADTVPGAEATLDAASHAEDLVFVIGDTNWYGAATMAWRLTADDWSGHLLPVSDHAGTMDGLFPIGALAAAAAAAAEPYRAALRSVAAATNCLVPEPWQLEPARAVHLRLAPHGTSVELGDVHGLDMVSGGALTSAALHALLRVPGLRAQVRVWEPQTLDASNLNRYVLMRRSMIDAPMTSSPKIAMLERWQSPSIAIVGSQDLVNEAVLARIQLWASWVFVGTDNVESRWLVQGSWPEHLMVAGTAGFMAVVSEHERTRPCAGCLHFLTESVIGDVPTVSFVSYLGGLLAAAGGLRWMSGGTVPEAEQMTEAWADRLDGTYGVRAAPIPRRLDCPVGCYAA